MYVSIIPDHEEENHLPVELFSVLLPKYEEGRLKREKKPT